MNSNNIIYSMKLRSFLQKVRPAPLSASIFLGAAILASTPALQAQVLYSGIRDILIPADFDGVYLDLDTGTSSTSATVGWDLTRSLADTPSPTAPGSSLFDGLRPWRG